MSRRHDNETSRVGLEPFPVTHWTEIFEAKLPDKRRRQAALSELLRRYWRPVYCYLRSKGHKREEAKDLTQDFLNEVLLGRKLIQRADRSKGRFRTFLLRSLDRYLTSVHRTQMAKRRQPEGGLVSLDGINWADVPRPSRFRTPAEAFDYACAAALLDEVIEEVSRKCIETGIVAHWDLFRERVLEPIVDDVEPPPLPQLCRKYHIESGSRASHMILTVKRRFQTVLRQHLRQLVESDADVDDELDYFMTTFSRGRARS
jgi:RNA polymerase sigma-70 factor (ECF subfamily)